VLAILLPYDAFQASRPAIPQSVSCFSLPSPPSAVPLNLNNRTHGSPATPDNTLKCSGFPHRKHIAGRAFRFRSSRSARCQRHFAQRLVTCTVITDLDPRRKLAFDPACLSNRLALPSPQVDFSGGAIRGQLFLRLIRFRVTGPGGGVNLQRKRNSRCPALRPFPWTSNSRRGRSQNSRPANGSARRSEPPWGSRGDEATTIGRCCRIVQGHVRPWGALCVRKAAMKTDAPISNAITVFRLQQILASPCGRS
jgi:hypothetical protein